MRYGENSVADQDYSAVFFRYTDMLKKYIYGSSDKMTRNPGGYLKYPYIVPSSPDSPLYTTQLWDWDSWLTSVMMGQIAADLGGTGEWINYEKGAVLNFLNICDSQGRIPINVTEQEPGISYHSGNDSEGNMHKPVLAQQAAQLIRREDGNPDWIMPFMDKLELFINRYFKFHRHDETGLLYWQDDVAVGVDNDPAVFYRPRASCGSIYLNCLMYRELKALGYIYEQAGDLKKANEWRLRGDELAAAINQHCWDERDGTYYSVDLNLLPVDLSNVLHQGAPRDYPCILLRIDNWSSFLPLWAGIASPEQAERMLERICDYRTFACRSGIRTLSRLEKMYDLRASANPSNWRGPVWGISNYLIFSGLVRYGFDSAAKEIAEKTIYLLGRDLEQNGCLHEYYHPDTCESIVTHGFENWNFLVLNMIAWIEGRRFVDTF